MQILWSVEFLYLLITCYSFSICQILCVSVKTDASSEKSHDGNFTVDYVFGHQVWCQKEINSGNKLITMRRKSIRLYADVVILQTATNPPSRLLLSYKWTFGPVIPVKVDVCFSRSTFNPRFRNPLLQ